MSQHKRKNSRNLSVQKTSQKLSESDIFYKHLAEVSPEAVVVHSEGIIVYANQAALDLVSAKRTREIIGQPVMKFVHPDSIPLIQARIKTMLNKHKVAPFVEEKFVNMRGEIIYAETQAVPFSFQEKPAILAILHDITERKKLEERQLFREQVSTLLGASIDYKTTLKNISKLLVPYFADFIRIVIYDENKELVEIAAHHDDPKKLRLVQKLYKAYIDRTKSYYGVDRILETGKSEMIEHVILEKYSKISNFKEIEKIATALHLTSYMGAPLKIQNKIIGVITFSSGRNDRIYNKEDLAFANEIAGRIAFAIENAQLYTSAQKAIQLRDEFISVASHELKTPITSLKMYTQTLHKQFKRNHDEKLSIYFEKMDQQTDKLSRLINDLLNVSKIQHGKLELEMKKVNLNNIIKDTLESILQTTQTHEVIIKGEVDKNIYVDAYRIYQVLTNLLTNAIKYSPKAKKIIIHIEDTKDHMTITVQDFGIGIEKDHLKRIFNQFYRVTNPEEQTFPGLGMGLYISNEIIKRHGGIIMVTSHKGKGSEFSFTLPQYKSSLPK